MPLTLTLTPDQRAAAADVVTFCRENGLPPTLGLAIVWGESGFDLERVGDNGAAFGGLQVHLPAHGGPPEKWTGRAGLLRSLAEMRDRWVSRYRALDPDGAWDHADAAGRAALLAQLWPAMQGAVPPTLARARECVAAADGLLSAAATSEEPSMPVFPTDAATGWLLPVAGTISQGYGPANTDPSLRASYRKGYHTGIDIAAPEGTPIFARQSGVVTRASDAGDGYGESAIVAAGEAGVTQIYGHMSRVDVAVGQQLAQGDRIGLVGSSGFVTGPHLHFEVRRGADDVDPGPWLASPVDPLPLTPTAAALATFTVTPANGLNLRDGPNGAVLIAVPQGTAVDLRADWLPVRVNGRDGWMHGAYLTRTPGTGDATVAAAALADLITAADMTVGALRQIADGLQNTAVKARTGA